jgi:hypothetical protein
MFPEKRRHRGGYRFQDLSAFGRRQTGKFTAKQTLDVLMLKSKRVLR